MGLLELLPLLVLLLMVLPVLVGVVVEPADVVVAGDGPEGGEVSDSDSTTPVSRQNTRKAGNQDIFI